VRNIMADLAEFYSANLAVEILKGSTQKASMGGTPYKAPHGYRNIRQIVGGFEVRTVCPDDVQGPLMRRAFELYDTQECSLRTLLHLLTREGLRVPATAKRPERPLSLSKFGTLLRNPYYAGVVRYRGVEYAGAHPALVSRELFDRVQLILDERDQHAL